MRLLCTGQRKHAALLAEFNIGNKEYWEDGGWGLGPPARERADSLGAVETLGPFQHPLDHRGGRTSHVGLSVVGVPSETWPWGALPFQTALEQPGTCPWAALGRRAVQRVRGGGSHSVGLQANGEYRQPRPFLLSPCDHGNNVL